jgi:hypothetical protein
MSEPIEPPEALLKTIGCGADDEPMDVFRWTQGARASYFLSLAALMAVFGAITALFVWMGWFLADRDANLAGRGFSALFLLLALWVAWGWVRHYRTTATEVFLYESGLVWHVPATGWSAGRWADAIEFYRSETREGSENASRCLVKFRDGEEVSFAAQIENYLGLAAHVQKLMHRALYPVLKARYDAGESVEFGSIVLTPTEFISKPGNGHLEWRRPFAKIREAEIARGCLWLNHITNRTSGFLAVLSEIPNYTVLFALLPFVPKGWNPAEFE